MVKICSDYDEDCADVECPLSCWLGGEAFISDDGVFFQPTPVADGICPLISETAKEREEENTLI